MSRRISPQNTSFVVQAAISTGTADNTVTSTTLIVPSDGARIRRFGVTKTTAGTGTGTMTVTLRARGASVDLSDPIVVDVDATAPTQQAANGAPQVSTGALIEGDRLDIFFDANGTVSGAATVTIWVEFLP